MNTKEIFSQLLRYFPAGEEARLYTNMRAFGEACLAAGEFEGAEAYADLLLAQDKNAGRQIAAYRIKLFAKLRCRTNEEFRHCAQFSKEMPEYMELIAACEADDKKLAAYIKLAKDNAETVAADGQKRAAQEKRERIRREKERAEEAERQRLAQLAEQERLRREREKAVRLARERERAERERQYQIQRQIRELPLKIFLAVIFILLPLGTLSAQIAVMATVSEEVVRNGIMAALCFATLLLTGFGGGTELLSDHFDEVGGGLRVLDYIIMGISILMILIVYFGSCAS